MLKFDDISYHVSTKFKGGITGTKATDMVEDLAALILSKSVIGEEFLVETDDIKVILNSTQSLIIYVVCLF